jgi:hypothetical protein
MASVDSSETGLTTKDIQCPSGVKGIEIYLDGRLIGMARVADGGYLAINQRKPMKSILEVAKHIENTARCAAQNHLSELDDRLDRLQIWDS